MNFSLKYYLAPYRCLKSQSLQGKLPPELARLHYLQKLDLSRNYLSGSLPFQWASMQINFISLFVNRLSGEIPKEWGKMSNLTYLSLESNQLNGSVPEELGNLLTLQNLTLSSNRFSGELPKIFSRLTNMKAFIINDNNFNGSIPLFIQYWSRLDRLDMLASGLKGPFPPSFSVLENLTNLGISDIIGAELSFPSLENMKNLKTLILRNCNISGRIPKFIFQLENLKRLDLSFNRLEGELPNNTNLNSLSYLYLSGNLLNGLLPEWTLFKNFDLSYNNFTLQGSLSSGCPPETNLFQSVFVGNNSSQELLPCLKKFECSTYSHSLHINCGGSKVTVHDVIYEKDDAPGGPAMLFFQDHWGFSSTGDFLDNNKEGDNYIQSSRSVLLINESESQLYTEARVSPLSLTYYQFCLLNGSYNVTLHFAEIVFTNDTTYKSLGRRIFDVYIQGKRVLQDFNIKDEAGGVGIAVKKQFPAIVTHNFLDIRFYWNGKGSTGIPSRGDYGPLISAISVDPNFPVPDDSRQGGLSAAVIVGIVASIVCLISFSVVILWWKGYLGGKNAMEQDLKGLDVQTGSFTLRQIIAATNNFDPANKIGEGGFGSVYKGLLADGKVIAVKQLSSRSRQGNREFVNEIGMISGLQHENLVKLYGCCIERNHLLLVYEYMENNSLARALFGTEESQLKLDWPTRQKICVGIARGLAFLHEESPLKIVHRDIKGTNILLDKDLNPKISDFGLAKLDEEENTHISTRVAGTIGYMAPEYALWGYLTDKADVYSFGVVALEIVSGKNNMSYRPNDKFVCLLDWACVLQQRGSIMELVDQKLGSEFNKEEAERMIQIALLCTNTSPTLRPTMSAVLSMLEGQTAVQSITSDPRIDGDDVRFQVIREHHQRVHKTLDLSGSETKINSSSDGAWIASSSTSAQDLYPIDPFSENHKNGETETISLVSNAS